MDLVRHRTRRLTAILGLAAVCLAAAAAGAGLPPQLLAGVGLRADDLGILVRGDWLGALDASTVPWLMGHQLRGLREPTSTLELGGNLLGLARIGPRSLDHAATVFMLHPRQPGFRGLTVPLPEVADAAGGLSAALASVSGRGGDLPVDLLPPPQLAAVAPTAVELDLPAELRPAVAELVATLAEAARWVDRSWLRVPPAVLAAALADPDIAFRLPAGSRWWPALDRAAQDGDDVARGFAALLTAAALDRAAVALAGRATGWRGRWQVTTARGRVVVAGHDDDVHRCAGDCLAIIDLGGNDSYLGSAGAGVADGAAVVAAVLDLAGDDRYLQGESVVAIGAGFGGVGVVVDLAGNDRYEGGVGTQGWGLLGYGILDDRGGDDNYRASSSAQGGAVFGGGLLLDRSGRDTYLVLGEGQGFGGTDGVGMLVDLAGDDDYRAEPDPRVAGRADYHAGGRVAAANSQGAGAGRRGDVGDGHQWAGGLGVIVDVSGNDAYRAGTFAQGSGYQLGTGMLLDGAGDDRYRSVYFAQGSASHGGIGVLLDAAGDDLHWLEDGAGLGYGWDAAVGLAVDLAGDDIWIARRTALGRADRRSFGLVLEGGGCDLYEVPAGADVLGAVDDNPGRHVPGGMTPAAADASQYGLFFDLGGRDAYPADERLPGDDRAWVWPDGGGSWAGHNLGAGLDIEW